jgi:intracellular septation protein A
MSAKRPDPEAAKEQEDRNAAPQTRPLTDAVRRSALASVTDGQTTAAAAVSAALGGVRGVVEAVLPGLVFLVVFTFWHSVPWSLALSVAAAAAFTLARLLRRSSPMQALVGLFGVVISAALALLTGKGEDNFVPGMIINTVMCALMLVTLLARRPLIGVVAGMLTDEPDWRGDRIRYRSMQVLTLVWAAMFGLRLVIEVPLYTAGNIEALAVARLLTGIPLYAPVFLLSWLIVRGVFRKRRPGADGRIVSTSR